MIGTTALFNVLKANDVLKHCKLKCSNDLNNFNVILHRKVGGKLGIWYLETSFFFNLRSYYLLFKFDLNS